MLPSPPVDPRIDPVTIASHLEAVRAKRPLVLNVTNFVAMNVAANALLAIGASPIMAENPEEMDELVAACDALSVNLGSVSGDLPQAMVAAAQAAAARDTPWVFDPVAYGVVTFRTRLGDSLLAARPAVIRGNASEIAAVVGGEGGGRGVDATLAADHIAEAAIDYAAATGTVVAATGPVDLVTDGRRTLRIGNGDPLMAAVTATGCQASALIGAFLGAVEDPFQATASALTCFAIAGEVAAAWAAGPGSLQMRLMDALWGLDAAVIESRCRLMPAP